MKELSSFIQKKLSVPFVLSLVLHLLIASVFLFLTEKKKEELPTPLTADIITPDQLPGAASPPPPPASASRPSQPSVKAPSRPSRASARPAPQKEKGTKGALKEKTSPMGELPTAGSPAEKAPSSAQRPGSAGSLPSTPSAPSAPSAPKTPSTPLREKLFDREVIGKLAQRRRETEKPDNGITFDSRDLKYSGYMQRLRERIESIWKYPAEAANKGIYGDLHIRFTIKKNGKIGAVELERTSGYKILDDAALKALKDAEPYWPLPNEWGEEGLTISGHFVYNIYGLSVR